MPSISTISIHRPEFQNFFIPGWPRRPKSRRIGASQTMSMDSKFSFTMNNKKEELSVQFSTQPIPKTDTLRSSNFRFDRLQPSDQELGRDSRLEFGQFVAREAVLDEEYWTAAWLRAESHWENRAYDRYTSEKFTDNCKRKFADQEFNELKRRCTGQNRQSCKCIVTVKKEQKNVKRPIIRSVVATLDLNVRYLLQGETFPGERVKAPLFCNINRTPASRYGYIANLCVAKTFRRQGIATSMLYFAVNSAKSTGVEQIYVHVDRNNEPALILYEKMGFEMVEMANCQLLQENIYLLRVPT